MEPFVRSTKFNPLLERIKLFVLSIDAKRAIKKSSRVIAISKFVRNFLVRSWGVPREKIGLVYHGVSVQESPSDVRPEGIPQEWRGSFIFSAGSIRPSRGLEDILNALKLVNKASSSVKGLVVAGAPSPGMVGYRRRLQRLTSREGLSTKICWVGHLNDSELAWCYRNCFAFVMASRVESFGMVAGEAMAHGCICISANSSSLPEIFGNAAIYYPLGEASVLAQAIQEVAGWDENTRTKASDRSRKQAAAFSWDICANKTVAELREAVRTSNRQAVL
jgi:glycosyltransferase involved in cell wall biosynthesis